MKEDEKTLRRVRAMIFASVYPFYIAKAERKGRTKAEVDEIVRWLTGYTQKGFENQLRKQVNFETFFTKAPKLNPLRSLITGVICGVRVEDIKDPIMREVRYLDKLIDELAKGRPAMFNPDANQTVNKKEGKIDKANTIMKASSLFIILSVTMRFYHCLQR